jgi:hypothetical protein
MCVCTHAVGKICSHAREAALRMDCMGALCAFVCICIHIYTNIHIYAHIHKHLLIIMYKHKYANDKRMIPQSADNTNRHEHNIFLVTGMRETMSKLKQIYPQGAKQAQEEITRKEREREKH